MTKMNFVVPDPLAEWEQHKKFAALRDAINEGLESGNAGELDIEAIKQRAREQAGLASATLGESDSRAGLGAFA